VLDALRSPRLAIVLLVASGCTFAPPPSSAPPSSAPPSSAPPAARAAPVLSAARKLEGDAAVLTPEGAAAGVQSPVKAKCVVSLRGFLHDCRLPNGLPESQQHAVWLALEHWRFAPARYDDLPMAAEHDLDVPLIAPPAGWSLSETTPASLRGFPLRPVPTDGHGSVPEGFEVPQLVSGPVAPQYPQQARERGIEGRVIARCTLTEEGRLEECDVIRSVPFLDQAVLAMLPARRYTPALYKGKPQRVYFNFPFKFKLP
jgi:TonB family protein